jgi:predicted ATPase
LAEAEAATGANALALRVLDDAIAESGRTGQRWYDGEFHRTRGAILLAQDSADPAPAEAAFLTAIAVAREQKARSFELRAALSLAKLYQSANRAIEARDILGPALEGFAPTPEFPEIEEGMGLLAAIKQVDAVS